MVTVKQHFGQDKVKEWKYTVGPRSGVVGTRLREDVSPLCNKHTQRVCHVSTMNCRPT